MNQVSKCSHTVTLLRSLLFLGYYFPSFQYFWVYFFEAIPSRNMLVKRVLSIFFCLGMFTVILDGHTACIVYSSNQLIALKLAYLVTQSSDIPDETLRKTHRGYRGETKRKGKRAGLRQKRLIEKRQCKPCPPCPSMAMWNILLARRQLDQLSLQHHVRHWDMVCWTLALLCRWDILHAIVVGIYIPPSANTISVSSVLYTATSQLQTKHPSALITISGDFNFITMDKTSTFTQYVSCSNRNENTLGLMYANIKDMYDSTVLAILGRSDHNLVHLKPCFVPLVKRKSTTIRIVRRCSEEAYEALLGCFKVTDWQALCVPHGGDIDGVTECIVHHIKSCGGCTVPVKTFLSYSNNNSE